jgi:hypothetical protein
MNCNFYLFFNFFAPKTYVLKSFKWDIIPLDFVGFFLGLPNLKMKLVTLNTNFHIDLGRFIGD